MSVSKSILFAACAALAVIAAASRARAGNYDEAILGDLSQTPAAPTIWNVNIGANTLKGTAGNGMTDDYDLVSFTIPPGARLDSITVASLTPPPGDSAFFGIQPGSPWLDGLGNGLVGNYIIGWALLDSSATGSDLMAAMLGFKLPDGTYTFEAQDIDKVFGYELTFNIVASPIPGNFDNNAIVDANDLTKWRNEFGTAMASDIDRSGTVDGHEFMLWQQSLGSAAITAAPEPSAAALALLAFTFRRARRHKP